MSSRDFGKLLGVSIILVAGCGGGGDESASGTAPTLCSVEPASGIPGETVTVRAEAGEDARFTFGGVHAVATAIQELTAQGLETADSAGCEASHVITLEIPQNCAAGSVDLKAFAGITESNALSFTCVSETGDTDDEATTDSDGDGTVDADDFDDDDDGIPDQVDTDDDGDGTPDEDETGDNGDDDGGFEDDPQEGNPCNFCVDGEVCYEGACQVRSELISSLGCNETVTVEGGEGISGAVCGTEEDGVQLNCVVSTDHPGGHCVRPAACTLGGFQPELTIHEFGPDDVDENGVPFSIADRGNVIDYDTQAVALRFGKVGAAKGWKKVSPAEFIKKKKTATPGIFQVALSDFGRYGRKLIGSGRTKKTQYLHLATHQEGYLLVKGLQDVSEATFLTYCKLDTDGKPIFFQDAEGVTPFEFAAEEFAVCNDHPDQCPGYTASEWTPSLLSDDPTLQVCRIKKIPESALGEEGAKFFFTFPTRTMQAKLLTRCEAADWVAQPIQQDRADPPMIENCKVRIGEMEGRILITAGATAAKHLSVRCGDQSASPLDPDPNQNSDLAASVGNFSCPAEGKFTKVTCEADGHAAQVRSETYCLEIGGGMSGTTRDEFLPKPQCVPLGGTFSREDFVVCPDAEELSEGQAVTWTEVPGLPDELPAGASPRTSLRFRWSAKQKYKVGAIAYSAACQDDWDHQLPGGGSGGSGGGSSGGVALNELWSNPVVREAMGEAVFGGGYDPREGTYRGETGWFLKCHLTNGDDESDDISTLGPLSELDPGEGDLGVGGVQVEPISDTGDPLTVTTQASGLINLVPTHAGFEYRTVCRQLFDNGTLSEDSWQSHKLELQFPIWEAGLVTRDPEDEETSTFDLQPQSLDPDEDMYLLTAFGMSAGSNVEPPTASVMIDCNSDRNDPIPLWWKGVNLKEVRLGLIIKLRHTREGDDDRTYDLLETGDGGWVSLEGTGGLLNEHGLASGKLELERSLIAGLQEEFAEWADDHGGGSNRTYKAQFKVTFSGVHGGAKSVEIDLCCSGNGTD